MLVFQDQDVHVRDPARLGHHPPRDGPHPVLPAVQAPTPDVQGWSKPGWASNVSLLSSLTDCISLTPLKGDWGCLMSSPPVWNHRAVI